MQGIDIAKAPVKFQPIIQKVDNAPKDGFISGKEAMPAATEISKFLGADTTLFKDNDKAMEYLMKVMGVEFVQVPEAEAKVIGATETSKGEAKVSKEEIARAIEIVKKNGHDLSSLSQELRNNKEVVVSAVANYGHELENVSESLKNDKEIVLLAVKQNGSYLRYASEALKNDKEFLIVAVNHNGSALEYASRSLKNNKEVVLAAVMQDGEALQYASEGLKVIIGQEATNAATKFSKEEVTKAIEIVINNTLPFRELSLTLRSNKKIAIVAVKRDGYELRYVSEALKNNKEVVMTAVNQYGFALEYASEGLRNDKEVVTEAVMEAGEALGFASEAFKNDKEVVMAAVKKVGSALKYASEELKKDKDYISDLFLISPSIVKFTPLGAEIINKTNFEEIYNATKCPVRKIALVQLYYAWITKAEDKEIDKFNFKLENGMTISFSPGRSTQQKFQVIDIIKVNNDSVLLDEPIKINYVNQEILVFEGVSSGHRDGIYEGLSALNIKTGQRVTLGNSEGGEIRKQGDKFYVSKMNSYVWDVSNRIYGPFYFDLETFKEVRLSEEEWKKMELVEDLQKRFPESYF